MRDSHVWGVLLDASSSRRHIERLGRAPSLARRLDDLLTDLVNAGASGHTPCAYLGDPIGATPHQWAADPAAGGATVYMKTSNEVGDI
jgi:hypothetical protein